MTRRRKGGSDSHFYYKWLDKALCDLQCARLLLTYGGDAYNIAFHCQQAIEKALKGYLLYRTGRHFDGHNLTYLCRQAIRLDPDGFSEYLDESAALNDLYIETRYPTDLPFEINEVEIRRYLDMAERMFAAIRRCFSSFSLSLLSSCGISPATGMRMPVSFSISARYGRSDLSQNEIAVPS